jgi:O-antigen/teichoic acid export membrane protein
VPIVVTAADPQPASRSASFGGDIMRYGTAIGVAVALGVVQVFVLPRRLDLTAYGQYRFFLIYFGYLGMLHAGIADGAFVRWADRSPRVVRGEWQRVLRWLVGLQLLFIIAVLTAGPFVGPLTRTYLGALALSALFVNVATLMSFALQAAGDFRLAGLIAVMPPAGFVALILLARPTTLVAVLGVQMVSLAITALVGIVAASRIRDEGAPSAEPLHLMSLVHVGAPVLGASVAAGLSQFADRILVSMVVPAASLALYGFASTVMVAASAATQTLSRVALAHAARRTGHERAAVPGGAYHLIIVGFGLALSVLPLFEAAVQRSLPLYVPALPIMRAMAIGAPFWVAIHVVLVGTLQSYRLVRRQLALELFGTTLVVTLCGGCLMAHEPLWVVAAAGATAAGLTWLGGVALVRRMVPASAAHDAGRFGVSIAWLGGSALLATVLPSWTVRTAAYVALAFLPTALAFRAARAEWRR